MTKDVRVLARLINAIQLRERTAVKIVSGGGRLSSKFQCNAEEFLQTAEDAFEIGNLSEAVTVAKRAIYCQIDEVLDCLGYIWKRKRIPYKLKLLKQCGFAAPRILKRVSDARNLLEHEYKQPSRTRSEEALDIATLFVSATRRHLDSWEDEYSVGNAGEEVDEFSFSRELSFRFDQAKKRFQISASTGVRPYREENKGKRVGAMKVGPNDALFPLIVKLTVANDRNGKAIMALHEIFDLVRHVNGG